MMGIGFFFLLYRLVPVFILVGLLFFLGRKLSSVDRSVRFRRIGGMVGAAIGSLGVTITFFLVPEGPSAAGNAMAMVLSVPLATFAMTIGYFLGWTVGTLLSLLGSGDSHAPRKQAVLATVSLLVFAVAVAWGYGDWKWNKLSSSPESTEAELRMAYKMALTRPALGRIIGSILFLHIPVSTASDPSPLTDYTLLDNLARNPSTPKDILTLLANDRSQWRRAIVAKNPVLPVEAVRALMKDPEKRVREIALERYRQDLFPAVTKQFRETKLTQLVSVTGNYVGRAASKVTGLVFSEDEATLLSAGNGDDGRVRAWSVKDGTGTGALPMNWGNVPIATSSEGSDVAFGTMEGQLELWNYKTGTKLWAANVGKEAVKRVAFSRDRATLAAAQESMVTFWEPSTGKPLRTYKGKFSRILDLGIVAGAPVVVFEDLKKDLRTWSPDRKEIVFGHDARSAALSPDGTKLVCALGDGRRISAKNLTDRRTLWENDRIPTRTTSVAWSQDGRVVVTGHDDGTARLWEAGTGKVLETFQGRGIPVTAVAISRAKKLVAVADASFAIQIWDVESGRSLWSSPSDQNRILSLAKSPDPAYELVSIDRSGVSFWKTSPEGLAKTPSSSDWTKRLANLRDDPWNQPAVFAAGGAFLMTQDANHTVTVFETGSGRVVHSHRIGEGVCLKALSSDGNRAIWQSKARPCSVVDLSTGRELASCAWGFENIEGATFSFDNRNVLLSGSDSKLREVSDFLSRRDIHLFEGKARYAPVVNYGSATTELFAVTADIAGVLVFWSIPRATWIDEVPVYPSDDFVTAMAVLPHGSIYAATARGLILGFQLRRPYDRGTR